MNKNRSDTSHDQKSYLGGNEFQCWLRRIISLPDDGELILPPFIIEIMVSSISFPQPHQARLVNAFGASESPSRFACVTSRSRCNAKSPVKSLHSMRVCWS